MRSRSAQLLASAVAIVIPTLMITGWSSQPAKPLSENALDRVEGAVGKWRPGQNLYLPDEVVSQIEPDSYVLREFDAPGAPGILMYAGLYAGRAGYGKGAHDPEVCYPAHGWEILGSSSEVVILPGGERFAATRLNVHKGSEKRSVLYWFQPADRWTRGTIVEEALRIVDAVRGRPQYAFVRISAAASSSQHPKDPLVEFARIVAPAIRQSVDNHGLGTTQPSGVIRSQSG